MARPKGPRAQLDLEPFDFDELVVGGKTINFQPDGLVFKEAASLLVGPDKRPITSF